jgi:transposase InsO family protein
MLSDDEFNLYCRRLAFPPETVELIRRIRSSPPSRRVSGGGRSVCARFASRKMGMTIQAESAGCELVYVYECEYDDKVLEFYDQPDKVKLEITTKAGHLRAVFCTPDFFVLAEDGAGWVECKTEEELLRREKAGDARFTRDNGRGWLYPSGQDYAARYNLAYTVWTPAHSDFTLLRNLRLLDPYMREDGDALPPEAREEVLEHIRRYQGIHLSELIGSLRTARQHTVLRMIACGDVFIDLASCLLVEPERCPVYSNRIMAVAYGADLEQKGIPKPAGALGIAVGIGKIVNLRGTPYTIAGIAEGKITLVHKQKEILTLAQDAFEQLCTQGDVVAQLADVSDARREAISKVLASATPQDLEVAYSKYLLIQPALGGKPTAGKTPERSRRFWLSRYRAFQEMCGVGFLGLIPLRARRGNRKAKMSEATEQAMLKFIHEHYEQPKQKNRWSVYNLMVPYCRSNGIDPASYNTLCKTIKRLSGPRQTEKRMGRRAAYQEEGPLPNVQSGFPRHGDRPFDVAHIDHTESDIELIHSSTFEGLGRPWETKLTDAFSRRILAVHVSYDKPSYRSCMMVLRECVIRHNRLPQTIISDQGPEFESKDYEILLAAYGITKKSRPAGKPRHGSIDERIFGTQNTQFIYNLEGNTQITKLVRRMTKAVNPKLRAKWTLPLYYERLREWCYEVYDNTEQAGLGTTPRKVFLAGMDAERDNPYTAVPYDESFKILSLPSTARRVATVDSRRGVKINYLYYWCDAFKNPQYSGKTVPVRYDPLDASTAYAYVGDAWQSCISQHRDKFRDRSHYELAAAAAELRAQYRLHGRKYVKVEPGPLSQFAADLEAQEKGMPSRLRDEDNRKVIETILPPDRACPRGSQQGAHRSTSNRPRRPKGTPPAKEPPNPARDYRDLEPLGQLET